LSKYSFRHEWLANSYLKVAVVLPESDWSRILVNRVAAGQRKNGRRGDYSGHGDESEPKPESISLLTCRHDLTVNGCVDGDVRALRERVT
jgi:hypothetical protein